MRLYLAGPMRCNPPRASKIRILRARRCLRDQRPGDIASVRRIGHLRLSGVGRRRLWLALAGLARYFLIHSVGKGGPRDDDVFPALSPAWPGQRPANAFAGLIRDFPDFLRNPFLVCPSWRCSVAPAFSFPAAL